MSWRRAFREINKIEDMHVFWKTESSKLLQSTEQCSDGSSLVDREEVDGDGRGQRCSQLSP